MNSSLKISQFSSFLVLMCLVLVSMACKIPSLSTPVPTATFPAAVDSPLKSKLLGQWEIISGGAWDGATLTFNEDGSFTIIGGSHGKDDKGDYFFTANNTIVFYFPNYQGSADIKFQNDDQMSLSVTKSDEIFGTIYSVDRVK